MSLDHEISVRKLTTPQERARALDVFQEVYTNEKGWVRDREAILPLSDLDRDEVDWFIALEGDRVVGVTRILYQIPVDLYEKYAFKLTIPGLNVTEFVKNNRIAEVGRFAVLPRHRGHFLVSALLMRATGAAAVARGFSHLITDVFEADPNTPHGFHRRVLGFKEVATHDVGELHCDSRRITMLLDLHEAAERISRKNGWFYRFLEKEAAAALNAY